MIADTCFLIDIQNSEQNAVEKAILLEGEKTDIKIPDISVCELYIGVGKGDDTEKNREIVEDFIEDYEILSSDLDTMRKAGEYEGIIQADDDSIGLADAIIGAMADNLEEAVVTDNKKDFSKIPDDLEIQVYCE